jgi:hypothetical protein
MCCLSVTVTNIDTTTCNVKIISSAEPLSIVDTTAYVLTPLSILTLLPVLTDTLWSYC